MPKGANQAVGIGQETTWGTAVAVTDTLLCTGSGLAQSDENNLTPVQANASFPMAHSHELISRRHAPTMTSILYPSNCALLLGLGNARNSSDNDNVYPYTIVKNEGVSAVGSKYTGARVNTQTLRWSSDGFVEVEHAWIAKGRTKDTFTPGTYPSDVPFHGSFVTLTVNGVAAVAVQSGEVTWNNNLEEGPFKNFELTFLDAGFLECEGSITAKFLTDAWNALARDLASNDLTEFDVVITLNGPGGETCVITLSDCKAVSAMPEVDDQGSTVMQTIQFRSATTAPTVQFTS